MTAFSIVIVTALSIISLYLAFRCIVLTKAINKYHELIMCLVTEETTRENIKIIVAAMYGLSVNEVEKRLKGL